VFLHPPEQRFLNLVLVAPHDPLRGDLGWTDQSVENA
jgi:hypothetical protein